jgi:hypothetical protein
MVIHHRQAKAAEQLTRLRCHNNAHPLESVVTYGFILTTGDTMPTHLILRGDGDSHYHLSRYTAQDWHFELLSGSVEWIFGFSNTSMFYSVIVEDHTGSSLMASWALSQILDASVVETLSERL